MIYVVGWQSNGGESWKSYDGGNIRDDNTYLTDDSYVSGPKRAKRFDSVEKAIDFGTKWIKEYTSSFKGVNPKMSTEKNKTILTYGAIDGVFGDTRLVIRPYRPRS